MTERKLVGFVYSPGIAGAGSLLRSLIESLDLQDSSWLCASSELDVTEETLADTSLIITAGGDGTILRAVRMAAPYPAPIVGVNMGRVGFMTELTVEEAAEEIPDYLTGRLRTEERMMLQATVYRGAGGRPRLTVHALNDVVVSRGEARLLDVEVRVDGADLYTYHADGLIVATATGSTGYALSAGGPVVHPEARLIQIQPVAAHLSFQTGLIASHESVIELRVGSHQAALTVDGFGETALSSDDRVVIERSPYVARFLRAGSQSAFYASLTRRLGVVARPTPQTRKAR